MENNLIPFDLEAALKEIWADVPEYEGIYKISSLGRLFSEKSGRELKLLYSRPYPYFDLCKNNKSRKISIHRILAQVFIPNPENKPQVNHINGNKRDFSLANLEWVTHSENLLHAHRIGLSTPHNRGKKLIGPSPLLGYKHSDETRKRCSARATRAIKEYGHPMQGKSHSAESRQKMRDAKLGVPQSDKQRAAISATRVRIKVGKYVNDVLVQEYSSIKEAAKDTGMHSGNIGQIVSNKIKTPKKYGYELRKI